MYWSSVWKGESAFTSSTFDASTSMPIWVKSVTGWKGSVGMVAAESVLNQFIYNVQSNPGSQSAFFSKPTTANYQTDTVQMDRVAFSYAVDLEALTNASTGAPLGGASLGGTNRMMKITVRVSWQMGNGPNQGRHQSEMTRLIHEDS